MITKEAFHEWKSNPTTIEIYKKLAETRGALEESLSSGQTLCTAADETHGSTARMVGNIEGLNQLLNIEFVDEKDETEVSHD